jgi:hypothetical protein
LTNVPRGARSRFQTDVLSAWMFLGSTSIPPPRVHAPAARLCSMYLLSRPFTGAKKALCMLAPGRFAIFRGEHTAHFASVARPYVVVSTDPPSAVRRVPPCMLRVAYTLYIRLHEWVTPIKWDVGIAFDLSDPLRCLPSPRAIRGSIKTLG